MKNKKKPKTFFIFDFLFVWSLYIGLGMMFYISVVSLESTLCSIFVFYIALKRDSVIKLIISGLGYYSFFIDIPDVIRSISLIVF